MAVKLMVFGARALQGTLIHSRLDDIRAAGITLAVVGTERDNREVENTGMVLHTAHVGTARDEDAVSDTVAIVRRFAAQLGLRDSEVMVVSNSVVDHMATRIGHGLFATPLALDMLLARSDSVEAALELLA